MVKEDKSLLRSRKNYEQCYNQLKQKPKSNPKNIKHVLGVKRKSALMDLGSYSMTESLTVDPMHDIFEGVVPYDVKLILHYIIYVLKLITLADLNDRIKNFNYGFYDKKNKPCPVSLDKCNTSLGQQASQH